MKFLFVFLFAVLSWAENSPVQIQAVIVSGKDENANRIKADEISRVGTLKPDTIRKKQAITMAQVLDDERGVDTQTACAFCGAKRITINGMKGEHTTILVDGLPLHSTVSSFYGVEAIPLGGVDSIDIYRGTGAALKAPESIGGAINIITREIVTDAFEFNTSLSDDGQKSISLLGTKKIGEKSGLLMAAGFGEILPIDLDHNRITESPRQKTHSIISKFSHEFANQDEVSLRLSYGNIQNVGGTLKDLKLKKATSILASSDDFIDRDVRKKYIGDLDKITDNIHLDRFEVASLYRKKLDEDSYLHLRVGAAHQIQKSLYSHGYDYDNVDTLWVGIIEFEKILGDHLWNIGFENKNQRMNSSSEVLYQNLKQDDLRYSSRGVFVQDTWFVDDNNELAAVLRFDEIRTEWTDLDKTLQRSVVSPRLFFKHLHNSVLTSRVSAGLGYRSPLTLFESQHGTTHDGFELDIDKLETAQSFVYSLSGQRQDDFFEFSSHITQIENMAYGVDRVDQGLPVLFKNSENAYTVSVFDFSYGRRIKENWTLEGIAEFFNYPSGYKEKLPVAAIEKRFSFLSNFDWGNWKTSQKLNLILERNLSSYGYDRHYNVAYTDQDPLSPTFGETFKSDQKKQKAPTFFTVDLTFERKISEHFYAGFSVLNVFDYTQTKAGDSPTTWDIHGDHYHLDNFHIWGPLKGRQIFANLRGSF